MGGANGKAEESDAGVLSCKTELEGEWSVTSFSLGMMD